MRQGVWLALVVGVAGCNAQLTPTDPVTSGTGGTRGTGGAGAGCPAEVLVNCIPSDCSDNVVISPVCIDNAWTCPANAVPPTNCPVDRCDIPLPFDWCTCNPATGAVTCANDAGPDSISGNDCPPPGQDGSIIGCVSECGSDTGQPPICAGGSWHCPRATVDVRSCPVQYCIGPPPPPGCTCNPENGALTCPHDAGSDANHPG